MQFNWGILETIAGSVVATVTILIYEVLSLSPAGTGVG